jgi:predicted porin
MKKIFSAALLLAAAGVAHADVTVYGLIDMSYSKSMADDLAGLKADIHSGGDEGSGAGNSASRIGFKGTTDVGSGIKANFKLETAGITSDGRVGNQSFTPATATASAKQETPFFNRAAWVGLSGSFGEVRLGRQDSVPFQTMIDFDFNGAANIASAYGAAGVAAWGTDRQSRSLQYINTLGGLKVQLGFVPEGNDAGAKATISGGATYTLNKLTVAATVESKRTSAGKDFAAVAAMYDLGVAKVAANYTDGGVKSNRGFGLGVTATIANGVNVGAQFGRSADKKTGIELFVNKEVLKNTYAYFDFGNLDSKTVIDPTVSATKKKETGFAAGVIYTF